MGHLHVSIARKLQLKPAGDLFRGPVQGQLVGYEILKSWIDREPALLGATCMLPSLRIGLNGAISPATTVAFNFTANSRWRPSSCGCHLPYRAARRDAPGDFFPLRQRQRHWSAPPD